MKALRFLRALPLALLTLTAPSRAEQGSIVTPIAGPMTMADYAAKANAALLAIQTCNSGTSAPNNGPSAVAVHFQCWADTSGAPVVTYKFLSGGTWVPFGKLDTSAGKWTPVYQGTDTGTASTANTGTAGHTLAFLDTANIWSGKQSFASMDFPGNSAVGGPSIWGYGNGALLGLAAGSSGINFYSQATTTTLAQIAPTGGLTLTVPGSALTLNGATSGSSVLQAPATGGGTLTMPQGTDTVVARSTIDTLINKTLVAPVLGAATATSINKVTITPPSAGSTLTIANGKTATFNNTTTFAASADGNTYTFPTASGSVVTADSTHTLTNKTFDTAGAGNSLSINGLSATANTGSGAVARAVGPSFTTPTLGAASASTLAFPSGISPIAGPAIFQNVASALLFSGGTSGFRWNDQANTAANGLMTLSNAGALTLNGGVATLGVPGTAAGALTLAGVTSGSSVLQAPATGGGTATLFAGTDTIVGRSTTDTLSNKTLVAPALGTPTSGVLTNATGLPISTGVSGMAAGAASFLAAPSSANLSALINDETGSGLSVFSNSPALTGTPTAPTAAANDNSTLIATTAYVQGQAAAAAPLMDGTAAVGTSTRWAKADHVHPIDTSRAPLASPALTGSPTAPTAAANDNSTQIATTGFVIGQGAVGVPLMDAASAATGTSLRWARADHVHPTDTSRAPLASPGLTGAPTAPTPSTSPCDNSTSIATTAFVAACGGGGGGGAVSSVNGRTGAVVARADDYASFDSTLNNNCGLAASVASNILTVNLTDAAGNTPSPLSPCVLKYRSPTSGSGAMAAVSQTATLSINTNAIGATLGSANGSAVRFWVVAFNNGGANVLALINCSNGTTIFPLDTSAPASSTAMSASATSAGVFYTPSGTTVTNQSFAILGYVTFNSISTAGTYAAAPDVVQVYGPGVRLPGDTVRIAPLGNSMSIIATPAGSTSWTSAAATASFTMRSPANLVEIEAAGSVQQQSSSTARCYFTIFRNGAAFPNSPIGSAYSGQFISSPVVLAALDKPNTSSVTYATYVRGDGTSACAYPDQTGSGNTAQIKVKEIMG